MSAVRLTGEVYAAEDRPGVPVARAGTLKRMRDLAMWAAWQAGIPVQEIAREFGLCRRAVYRRIQFVRRSGLVHDRRLG